MNKNIKELIESIKKLSLIETKELLILLEDTSSDNTIREIVCRFIKDKFNFKSMGDAYAKYWNGKFYNNGTVIYIDNKKVELPADIVKQIQAIPVEKKDTTKNWREVYSKLCDVRQELAMNMRDPIIKNKYKINAYQLKDEISFLIEVLAKSDNEEGSNGTKKCRAIAKTIMRDYPKK